MMFGGYWLKSKVKLNLYQYMYCLQKISYGQPIKEVLRGLLSPNITFLNVRFLASQLHPKCKERTLQISSKSSKYFLRFHDECVSQLLSSTRI